MCDAQHTFRFTQWSEFDDRSALNRVIYLRNEYGGGSATAAPFVGSDESQQEMMQRSTLLLFVNDPRPDAVVRSLTLVT